MNQNISSLPIACTLTAAELQRRRSTVLDAVKKSIIEVRELPDGYSLSFPATTESLKDLTNLVDLERQCCPFLTFRITVEPNSGPLWLEVSGPDGSKDFLRHTFDWNMS